MANVDDGIDIAALDDLPDPEELCTGDLNVAYAQGRRLLTADGALEEMGDTAPYTSIDIRDWLGERPSSQDIADKQALVSQIQSEDERVDSADAIVEVNGGGIEVRSDITGAAGTFPLVMKVDNVRAKILKDGGTG